MSIAEVIQHQRIAHNLKPKGDAVVVDGASSTSVWYTDLTMQPLADCVWLTLRDDEAQTHGTVCRSSIDAQGLSREDAAGLLGTSMIEAEILLGNRDDPLINILAASILRQAAAVTTKPVLLCIALGKATNERLSELEERRRFISATLVAVGNLLLPSDPTE